MLPYRRAVRDRGRRDTLPLPIHDRILQLLFDSLAKPREQGEAGGDEGVGKFSRRHMPLLRFKPGKKGGQKTKGDMLIEL